LQITEVTEEKEAGEEAELNMLAIRSDVPESLICGRTISMPPLAARIVFTNVGGSSCSTLALFDTGATANFVRSDYLTELDRQGVLPSDTQSLKSVNALANLGDSSAVIPIDQALEVAIQLGEQRILQRFLVCDNLRYSIVIGLPLLHALDSTIKLGAEGKRSLALSDKVERCEETGLP